MAGPPERGLVANRWRSVILAAENNDVPNPANLGEIRLTTIASSLGPLCTNPKNGMIFLYAANESGAFISCVDMNGVTESLFLCSIKPSYFLAVISDYLVACSSCPTKITVYKLDSTIVANFTLYRDNDGKILAITPFIAVSSAIRPEILVVYRSGPLSRAGCINGRRYQAGYVPPRSLVYTVEVLTAIKTRVFEIPFIIRQLCHGNGHYYVIDSDSSVHHCFVTDNGWPNEGNWILIHVGPVRKIICDSVGNALFSPCGGSPHLLYIPIIGECNPIGTLNSNEEYQAVGNDGQFFTAHGTLLVRYK